MENLKNILYEIIKKKGLERLFLEHRAVKLWNKIVGKPIADKTDAVDCDDGVLKVFCPDPVWRNELVFLKKDIIKKINKYFGREIIKDIRFVAYRRRENG